LSTIKNFISQKRIRLSLKIFVSSTSYIHKIFMIFLQIVIFLNNQE